MYTATYSPEDNKLRLYSVSRLDAETYVRVKAAGFIWAPKQGLFVAPMWTPYREDLLTELAGEIGDEDTSLVDRAEQRAERFEDYSESRTQDAESARKAVARIADGIPLGQPILVGHHSERHARKDAEKIENGMRRAVKMWETAKYWQSRAAGAIHAAKYKELPAVRARRIKGLESDKRSHERDIERAETFTKLWSKSLEFDPEIRRLTREQARAIANYDRACSGKCFTLKEFPRNPPASQYEGAMGLWSALGDTDEQAIITPEQARDFALRSHAATIRHANRWLGHINNRLEYERAMLAEGGGLATDKFDLKTGGRVCRRGQWFVIVKLNKRNGAVCSVTVIGHWATTVQVEEITDYRPPDEGDGEKVTNALKPLPLCNFRVDGCIEMTAAEWKERSKWGDALAVRSFDASGEFHWRQEKGAAPLVYRHRSRYYLGDHIKGSKVVPVFLTDAKVTNPPASVAPRPRLNIELPEPEARPVYRAPEPPTEFDAMRDALRSGSAVQVVSAPQLFPTPMDLARRMVEVADIQSGQCVLEPSAGTGNIVRAVLDSVDTEVLAYEINQSLCSQLTRTFPSYKLQVRCNDFLEITDFQGCYERILMNPPFQNAADIAHIKHAVKFLKPGGRLVAICAGGPRQKEALEPLADLWEPLPAGSFDQSGTGVNTVLITIEAPEAEL